MVFHRRLPHPHEDEFTGSHLFYAKRNSSPCQARVKLHGVFLSFCGSSESARTFQFRRGPGRDSAQVVTPFVRVGTYPTRNFATLGPLELRPPFTGASVQGGKPLPLTFRHWAGVSPHTSPYGFAETCVFVKQSLEPIICASQLLREQVPSKPRGPLLANLRGQFAEFLSRDSPERLRGLPPCLPVSVCGTDTIQLARGFSCRYGVPRIGFGLPRSLSITSHGLQGVGFS